MQDIDELFEENKIENKSDTSKERGKSAKGGKKPKKEKRNKAGDSNKSYTLVIFAGRALAVLALLMLTGNFTFEKPGIRGPINGFLGELTYSRVENLTIQVENKTYKDMSADTVWELNGIEVANGSNTFSMNGWIDQVEWGTNTIVATNGEDVVNFAFSMNKSIDTDDARHNELSLMQYIPDKYIGDMDDGQRAYRSEIVEFVDGSIQERIQYEQDILLAVNCTNEGVMSIKESMVLRGMDAVQIDGDWSKVYSAQLEISNNSNNTRVYKFDSGRVSEIYPDNAGDVYIFKIKDGGNYIIDINGSRKGYLDDTIMYEIYTIGFDGDKEDEVEDFTKKLTQDLSRVDTIVKKLSEDDLSISMTSGNFLRRKEMYIINMENQDIDGCKGVLDGLVRSGAGENSIAICLSSSTKGLKSISFFQGEIIECDSLEDVDIESVNSDLRIGEYINVEGVPGTIIELANSGFDSNKNGFATTCKLNNEMQGNNSYGMCLIAKGLYEGNLTGETVASMNDWAKNWYNSEIINDLGLNLNPGRLDGNLDGKKISEISEKGLTEYTRELGLDSDVNIMSLAQLEAIGEHCIRKVDNNGNWVYDVIEKLGNGEPVIGGVLNEHGMISVLITKIYNESKNYNNYWVEIYNPVHACEKQYVHIESGEDGPVISYDDGALAFNGFVIYTD